MNQLPVKLRVIQVSKQHVRVAVFTNGINNGQLCFVHNEFRRFLDCLDEADVTFDLAEWENYYVRRSMGSCEVLQRGCDIE